MGAFDLSSYLFPDVDQGRQPQQPVGINWSNPITRGLRGVWSFAPGYVNYVRGRPATIVGSISSGVWKSGVYALGSSSSRIDTGLKASDLGISGVTPRTIIIHYRHLDASGGGSVFSVGDVSSNGAAFQIKPISYDTVRVGGFYADWNMVVSAGGDRDIFLAVSYDGTTASFYAINLNPATGVVTRYSGSSALALNTGDGNTLSFLGTAFDGSSYVSRAYFSAIFSGRVLSTSEIDSIYANSGQILAPTQIPFSVSAAGGTTSVSNDSSPSYLVRNAISADIAALFSVRTSAQSDKASAYAVRSAVQASQATTYDVLSSTSVGSSCLSAYAVRGSVAANGVTTFSVRGSVNASSAAAYAVRSKAYRDNAANYAIYSSISSVVSDNAASYSIFGVVPDYPTAESIASAVLSALNATTIPVDAKRMNGADIIGDGSESNHWRGVGVQP